MRAYGTGEGEGVEGGGTRRWPKYFQVRQDKHLATVDKYIHTHIHTYKRTNAYVLTYTRIYMHTHTHACTRIHNHTRMHAHPEVATHTKTFLHTHIRTRKHTLTHKLNRTHTHTHIHTHTQAHAHALSLSRSHPLAPYFHLSLLATMSTHLLLHSTLPLSSLAPLTRNFFGFCYLTAFPPLKTFEFL